MEEEIVDILAEKYGARAETDQAVIADDVWAMICEMADVGFLM